MKQYISSADIIFLLIGFIIGTALMLLPTAVITGVRQDGWLAIFLGMLPSVPLVLLLISIQKMFPGKSLIEYSQEVLGKFAGKLAGAIFLWFILHLASLVLRNLGDFIKLAVLNLTPQAVVHATVIIIAIYAVKSGLEIISRLSTIIVPVTIIFVMIINILVTPKAQLSRLVPLLENGLKPLVKATLVPLSFPFGEIVLFAMLFSQVKDLKRLNKSVLIAIIAGFIVLDLATLRSIAVLGAESSARYVFPALQVIEEAPSSFVLEILLTLSWYGFMFIKLIICYYVFVLGAGQWLGVDYQSIVIPAGVIIVSLSILVYPNVIEEAEFASKIWPVYAIPIEFGLPLLLWLAAKAKRKAPT